MYSHHGWPVVAETWGGMNTDIHDFKSTLTHDQVVEAIDDAATRDKVLEGSHGGGSAMLCLGHKGGTGTSSRLVPKAGGSGEHYTVGVLVQTNFGSLAMLQIGGVPIGKLLIRDQLLQKDANAVTVEEKADRTGSEGSKFFQSATTQLYVVVFFNQKMHRHCCMHNHRCPSPSTPASPSCGPL